MDRSTLMGMSGRSLDPAVVADYRRAALNNAHDLIADAQLLMDHQRWPRACSLAVLATEETAKAWVCCMLPMLPDEAARHFSWPLSEINRTHGLKLEMAGMLTHVLDFYEGGPGAPERYASDLAELGASGREDNERKKRGLYVGLSNDQVTLPSEITEREATDVLDRAVRLAAIITHISDYLASPPPEVLAAREGIWTAMMSAYEQGGLDGIAELSQSSFGNLPEEDVAKIRAAIRRMTDPTQDGTQLPA